MSSHYRLHMEKDSCLGFSAPHFDSSYSHVLQNNLTKEEFNKMIQQINDYQDESYPKKTIIWGCGIGGTLIGFSLTALLGAFLTSLLYLISLLSIIPIVGAYFLIIYLNQSWKKGLGEVLEGMNNGYLVANNNIELKLGSLVTYTPTTTTVHSHSEYTLSDSYGDSLTVDVDRSTPRTTWRPNLHYYIEIRFLGRSSPAVSYGAVNNAYQQPPLLPPQFNPPLNNYPPPLANNFYPPANNYPPPLANNNYPPPLANNNYPPPLANNNFLPPPDLQNYNNVNRELEGERRERSEEEIESEKKAKKEVKKAEKAQKKLEKQKKKEEKKRLKEEKKIVKQGLSSDEDNNDRPNENETLL